MFHKPKFFRLEVGRNFVYPLRLVFFLIACIYGVDLYELTQSPVIDTRYGSETSFQSSPFLYLSVVLEKIAFFFFFLYLVYAVKEKGEGE